MPLLPTVIVLFAEIVFSFSTIGVAPPPDTVAQTPSPRQNVLELADVPELRLVTGRLPVTPVVNGKPVALVSVPDVGVPRIGVIKVGDVDKTLSPVPVLVVTPVPPFTTGNAVPE